MPGKFPTKVIGSIPTNKDGHVAVRIVAPEMMRMTSPAMTPNMMPTALTKGMRRPGNDG